MGHGTGSVAVEAEVNGRTGSIARFLRRLFSADSAISTTKEVR